MDEKGRICIPLEIRKQYDLKPGEKYLVRMENDKIILKKAISPDEFLRRSKKIQDQLDKVFTEPLVVKKIF